eukprot:3685394-Karenia_brevis.AAC.1
MAQNMAKIYNNDVMMGGSHGPNGPMGSGNGSQCFDAGNGSNSVNGLNSRSSGDGAVAPGQYDQWVSRLENIVDKAQGKPGSNNYGN